MANDIKSVFNRIQEQIVKSVQTIAAPTNFTKYMKEAAAEVKLRTRLGYGNDRTGGKKARLARLAESTKRARRYKKDRGDLSNATNPNTSNLTDTGQMLDALDGVATGVGVGAIFLNDSREDPSVTNTEVAVFAHQGGRHFLYLTDLELKRLTDSIRKDLIKSVRTRLTK